MLTPCLTNVCINVSIKCNACSQLSLFLHQQVGLLDGLERQLVEGTLGVFLGVFPSSRSMLSDALLDGFGFGLGDSNARLLPSSFFLAAELHCILGFLN